MEVSGDGIADHEPDHGPRHRQRHEVASGDLSDRPDVVRSEADRHERDQCHRVGERERRSRGRSPRVVEARSVIVEDPAMTHILPGARHVRPMGPRSHGYPALVERNDTA